MTAFAALSAAADAPRQTAVYFGDSRVDLVVLGNPTYEIAFRKSNGAIAYITDKTTGRHVTEGSAYECLWGVFFRGSISTFIGASRYDAAAASRFRYAWTPDTNTLTLSYEPDPLASRRVTAEVLVTASEGAWFDMRLHLENHTGAALVYVLFPYNLVFAEDDIQEALLPVLPGVVLERGFFTQHRTYTARYPGYPGLFADYLGVSSNRGQLALYAIHDGDRIRPTEIGFVDDDAHIPGATLMRHMFGTEIGDGEAWDSPPVRIRISESFLQTVGGYRVDNGLDKMRSLREKLGPRYTQVVQSPMYKADAVNMGIPFDRYASALSAVPSPGILHLVAFQPGGHDHSYPDFLPPAPVFGSTSDFADMCRHAKAIGLLVMPYTNPTWWLDSSPTLLALPPPLHIEDVAAVDENGRPLYENPGYVMSPFAPFVQDRLDRLVQQMTVTIPSDLLFEDQIAARPWQFDYNVNSGDASAYIDAWLQHTRTYSDRLLMTELGFDRLAETEVGFAGSVLLPERIGLAASLWGTGTWHVFPLAAIMTRDKVLFFQHNLAAETMTNDAATLRWNLAFGYMLGYDIAGGRTDRFLALVAAIQKDVLALYASERITDFENLRATATRTSFESFKVTANWDDSAPFADGGYTLSPGGVMTRSDDGTATAGVFWTYNGVALSPGEHYLIERRDASGISVYQPLGADTSLTVSLPAGWNAADIVGVAYNSIGDEVARVPLAATADAVTFTWRRCFAPPMPPTSSDGEARGSQLPGGVRHRPADTEVYVIRIQRGSADRAR